MTKCLTIVEVPGFLSRASGLMTTDQHIDLIEFMAMNPKAGSVIRGTGGVRKLRWQSGNTGKRGGNRVIYFFHDMGMPLYLLTIYPKSRRADLSAAERKDFKRLTSELVKQNAIRKTT